ncbi:MAG: cell division protein SepF [Candidatus Aenigmarchaeota archaeon]|nr:cell division protein SepF [Candidatus Aenigmarchaeota archaeon]
MPLKRKLLGGREDINEDDFLEITHEDMPNIDAISIKVAKINDYGDVDYVQKAVRDGNIVFVKIKALKEKDMSELKRAIERLRKTVTAINGDIAGIDENFIVVTPSFARVDRSNIESF